MPDCTCETFLKNGVVMRFSDDPDCPEHGHTRESRDAEVDALRAENARLKAVVDKLRAIISSMPKRLDSARSDACWCGIDANGVQDCMFDEARDIAAEVAGEKT